MKIKLLAASMLLVSAQGYAGVPEFDTVGDDSSNYFNDGVKQSVVANNIDGFGNNVNQNSDWTNTDPDVARESFESTGSPNPDPCFAGYNSRLAGQYNTNEFHWEIVLQMKPESDLDLGIRDCVLSGFSDANNINTAASQTGRYRTRRGALRFFDDANPRITAVAYAGPRNNFQPFTMDYRAHAGLELGALEGQLYTSKALWQEHIVLKMPEDGSTNESGQPTVRLREGDSIMVWIQIPGNNSTNLYYGQDNVTLDYVGERGTAYLTD
jgi:hypothetical protein